MILELLLFEPILFELTPKLFDGLLDIYFGNNNEFKTGECYGLAVPSYDCY